MKLALSDNDMPNRSPIFQTKCRNEGDVRGVSIFERMGLYKSDCPLAKWSMFSCSISRFSFGKKFCGRIGGIFMNSIYNHYFSL